MNQREAQNYGTRIEIYVVGFVSVVIGLFISFFVNRCLPINTPLATVDITSIIHQFVTVESNESTSSAQLKAEVQTFSNQLEDTLQAVAKDKHVVLIPKEAVIAGSIDLTPEVMRRLEETHALKD